MLPKISRNYYFVFLVLYFFSLHSCVKDTDYALTDKSYLESTINIKKSQDIQNKYIQIVSYVKLEKNKNSQLSDVSKVVYSYNKYIVFDKRFSSIKIFAMNGKFLANVGRIGQGEGEYLSAEDFFVSNNKIYVLSNNSRRLYIYDIDGKYIKSKLLSFYASELENLSENNLAFFTNFNASEETSNLLTVDSNLQVQRRYFSFKGSNAPAFDFTGFIEKSGSVLYSTPLSDSVFCVKKDTVYLKYKFEFDDGKCPDNIKNDVNKVLVQLKRFTYIEKPIIETSTNLFFRLIVKGEVKYAIFDRKSKILYTSSKNSLTAIFSKPVGYENENCIGTISPQNFVENKNLYINKYLMSTYPKLGNMLDTLKYSDNPVIIVYRYKK